MLCLAILVGVLAFAGCKQKNNDETTVPPNTDAAIDNIVGDDTEPALEDTTQSAQPGQPVQPAKPAQQVQPTKPASKKPVATTQKPEQAVKPTPSKPTIPKPDVKEDNWKPAGTYLCNRDIAADTYYIRPSKKMSAVPSPSLTAKTPQSFPCPTDCLCRSKGIHSHSYKRRVPLSG